MKYHQKPKGTLFIQAIFLVLAILIFFLPASAQSGGTFQISPAGVTGGGNTTSNGSTSIAGSVGQPTPITILGEPFAINGGVFGLGVVPFTFGDINMDGTISVTDLIDMANLIAGNIPANSSSINLAAGDLNQDGTVTVTDLIILANFIAGNIQSLPVGQ